MKKLHLTFFKRRKIPAAYDGEKYPLIPYKI